MKEKLIVVLTGLLFFFVVSCGGSGGGGESEDVDVFADGHNDWTIMVYMDGDNDLEYFAMGDMQEMMDGYSNEKVEVIVLIDRIDGQVYDSTTLGEDFTGTRLYRMREGNAWRLPDITYLGLTASGDNEELNMGDAHTLQKFIKFSKEQFPADHYALVLWNHGSGVRDATSNSTTSRELYMNKAICEDSTSGDIMYTAEITDVLTPDESVDLLGFDACLMGSVEVAYQYRTTNNDFNGQIMVASPPNEWGNGWDYRRILQGVGLNSAITAAELGELLVQSQQESTVGDSSQALACYDMSKVDAVKTAVDTLAVSMSGWKADIEAIRGSIESPSIMEYYNENYEEEQIFYPFFDLYELASAINANATNDTVKDNALIVKNAIVEMVLYSFANSDYPSFVAGKHGLHIFFPEGDKVYSQTSEIHWTYQWWYTSIDTGTELDPTLLYGKLSWCADGATSGNDTVENWFELLDSWYDTANDSSFSNLNGYIY